MNLYIQLLFAASCIGGISLLNSYLRKVYALRKASKGELPKRLKEFPSFSTDYSKFKALELKCKKFKELVLAGNNGTLSLNGNEINELYFRGNPKSKFLPNTHRFYEIKNGRIIENELQWPESTWDGCAVRKREITFVFFKDELMESSIVTYDNDYLFDNTSNLENIIKLVNSRIISFCFSSVELSLKIKFKDPEQYDELLRLSERLTQVIIEDDYLLMEYKNKQESRGDSDSKPSGRD